MFESSAVPKILAQFDIRQARHESLGNAGGFSGSEIFKVQVDTQTLCLKKWPKSTDKEKLRWIHRVLIFTAANGCPELTTPCAAADGSTFVTDPTGIWELTPWAQGKADYLANPNEERLNSVLEFLARFHQAAARFYFDFSPSQNAQKAVDRLADFDAVVSTATRSSLVQDYFSSQQLSEFARASKELIPKLAKRLSEFRYLPLPNHPVIRDIRSEHLYFDADRIASVIDFGAMRIDSIACDLSRLLACCGSDNQKMQLALDKYHSFRPLSEPERNLVPLLDRAGVVIGILNWMDWLFNEQREFEDPDLVRSRINSLMERFAMIAGH